MPSSVWSKIGRLKRAEMPKLAKGSTIFGSGASPGIMSCIAGRLLCDTYLCSRDLLKEVGHLCRTFTLKMNMCRLLFISFPKKEVIYRFSDIRCCFSRLAIL